MVEISIVSKRGATQDSINLRNDDCADILFGIRSNQITFDYRGIKNRERMKRYISLISHLFPGTFAVENGIITWTGNTIGGAQLYCLYIAVRYLVYESAFIREFIASCNKINTLLDATEISIRFTDCHKFCKRDNIYADPRDLDVDSEYGIEISNAKSLRLLPSDYFNFKFIKPWTGELNSQFRYSIVSA